MSGKTTYLKQVATLQVLAQVLIYKVLQQFVQVGCIRTVHGLLLCYARLAPLFLQRQQHLG